MRRHRVVWDLEAPRDLASRQSLGFGAYEKAEHFEAGALRQRRQGQDDLLNFHISRLIDMKPMTQEPRYGFGGQHACRC